MVFRCGFRSGGGVGLSGYSNYEYGSADQSRFRKRSRFRYSYRELLLALPTLEQASKAAAQKDSRDRDLYDREALKLASRLTLLQFSLTAFEDPRLIPAEELFPAIQRYMKLEDKSIPMVVPPSLKRMDGNR